MTAAERVAAHGRALAEPRGPRRRPDRGAARTPTRRPGPRSPPTTPGTAPRGLGEPGDRRRARGDRPPRLPARPRRPARRGPRRVLHVATECAAVGGHSRMAWRWIERDTASVPTLALTRQRGPVPDRLSYAVGARGGRVAILEGHDQLARARDARPPGRRGRPRGAARPPLRGRGADRARRPRGPAPGAAGEPRRPLLLARPGGRRPRGEHPAGRRPHRARGAAASSRRAPPCCPSRPTRPSPSRTVAPRARSSACRRTPPSWWPWRRAYKLERDRRRRLPRPDGARSSPGSRTPS